MAPQGPRLEGGASRASRGKGASCCPPWGDRSAPSRRYSSRVRVEPTPRSVHRDQRLIPSRC
eukprot:8479915-Pyramimonas_sp.AAC.1